MTQWKSLCAFVHEVALRLAGGAKNKTLGGESPERVIFQPPYRALFCAWSQARIKKVLLI
jgi:hypothetical protein